MAAKEKVVYEHRQIGWVTIVLIFVVVTALSIALGISERTAGQRDAFNAIVFALAVIAAIFSSLQIRITKEYIAWWFGLPFIGRRVRLKEIDSVAAIRTNIVEGWGIHLTWHGWLWNVSGFNAVQIVLRSGTRYAVGTPEPQAVIDAIYRARPAIASRSRKA